MASPSLQVGMAAHAEQCDALLQTCAVHQGYEIGCQQDPQQHTVEATVLHRKCLFHLLHGAMDDILVSRVMVYLDADELIAMSITSQYFARLSRSPVLWSALLNRDFKEVNGTIQNGISQTHVESSTHVAKVAYGSRYVEYVQRTKQAKEWDVEAQAEAAHSAQVRRLEELLDFLQVRIIVPLLMACVILTIVLFCQKVDGLDISMWACFIPLLIALVYNLLSFRLLQVVHKHQFSTKQLLRGMWNNFRGPVVFVYQEVLGAQMRLVYVVFAFLVVCIVQVLLVATKLSASTPSHLRDHYLPWAVVFIPVWLVLVSYCALPIFVRDVDPGVFLSLLCLFFVPLLIFFACLAVKLTGVQQHTKHRKIRLALMLIPFWILEAVALLGSLLFLLAGLGRYRRGLERLREYLAVFLLTWGTLVPFVIFQSLLCARDDYQHDFYGHNKRHDGPTATETVAPVLVLLGWVCIATSIVSFSMKTAYQEARERLLHDASGLRTMYQF